MKKTFRFGLALIWLHFTFLDLADPVIIRFTVSIVPVLPIVLMNLCTVFTVHVVVWFSVSPVLKLKLGYDLEKKKCGLVI